MYTSNVIFYSKKCKYSNEVLSYLGNIPIVKICIDNRNLKIPKFLKVVPTIVLKDGSILTGEPIKRWIMTQLNGGSQSIVQKAPNPNPQQSQPQQSHPQQTQPTSQNDAQNSDISPFLMKEMTGYSDSYSYLGEGSEVDPLSHSFSFTDAFSNLQSRNSNVSQTIKTVSDNSVNSSSNNKFNQLDDAYEKLKRSREIEMPKTERI